MIFLSRQGNFLVDKKEGRKLIKNFYRTEYSVGKRFYHIRATPLTFEKLKKYAGKESIDESCYLYSLVKVLSQSGMSPQTRRIYYSINLHFLKIVKKTPENITETDIKTYLSILGRQRKSKSTIRVSISALEFFYKKVLKRLDFSGIEKPHYNLSISNILSREEVKKLIESVKNKKHRLLIELTYGCGLKTSEAVKVRWRDLNLKKKILHIKGTTCRTVPIPESLINRIEDFRKSHSGSKYLFYSDRIPSKHISVRAAEKIFKKALENAGIKRNLSFKALRDSFAAHMIQKGVDPDVIRRIMGIKAFQFKSKYGFIFGKTDTIPDLLDFTDISTA
ncbi:MAG: tyrosine-type recombinase/integrase [Aquificae bacterium]|nr:tyrosine-type recombinase/integrase [Aquificota bacterium]